MSGLTPGYKERACILGCLLILVPGCGGSGGSAKPEEERRLKSLATLYVRYGANPVNKGKAPPNEKAFKDFIGKISPQELKAMGVTDVDALFRSPRDDQPYVVNYNIKAPPGGLHASGFGKSADALAGQVLAYEATGSYGKRYVVFATGQIELANADRARELNLK